MQLGAGGDASVLKGLDDFNLDLFDGDEFFEDDAAAADGINSFGFICGGGGDGPALFSGDGVTRAASGGDSAAGSSEKHPATSDDPKTSTTRHYFVIESEPPSNKIGNDNLRVRKVSS